VQALRTALGSVDRMRNGVDGLGRRGGLAT